MEMLAGAAQGHRQMEHRADETEVETMCCFDLSVSSASGTDRPDNNNSNDNANAFQAKLGARRASPCLLASLLLRTAQIHWFSMPNLNSTVHAGMVSCKVYCPLPVLAPSHAAACNMHASIVDKSRAVTVDRNRISKHQKSRQHARDISRIVWAVLQIQKGLAVFACQLTKKGRLFK